MPVAMGFVRMGGGGSRGKILRVHVYSQNLRERAEMDLQDLEFAGAAALERVRAGGGGELVISGAEISGARICWWKEKFQWARGFRPRRLWKWRRVTRRWKVLGLSRKPVELAKICQRAEKRTCGDALRNRGPDDCPPRARELMRWCWIVGRWDSGWAAVGLRDAQFVVCNSMVKHDHAAGEVIPRGGRIAKRRRRGYWREQMPGVRALRDVSLGDLER